MSGAPVRDVAVYSPHAAELYERQSGVSGGAELQTVLLCRGLAAHGLRCAHIVLPVQPPVAALPAGLELVERMPFAGLRMTGKAEEARRVWRAFAEADARVYVFRGGWPALGVAARFCRRHGRSLVFAAASDLNFLPKRDVGRAKRLEYRLYRHGGRRADAIVVQTGAQGKLAREMFPRAPRIVEIPSFAERAEPATAPPEAFLWTGRLDGVKNPEAYLELARAVPEARFWMIPKFASEDPGRHERVRSAAAALPNLDLLDARPRPALMDLVERTVAIVNTSPREGMPNLFLEGWARGIPALTLAFDPDGRIESRGLGAASQGSPERFAEAARELWERRGDRAELSERVRAYVEDTHGVDVVTQAWAGLIRKLA